MTVLAPRPEVTARVERVLSPAPRADWRELWTADPTALADQSPEWVDVMSTAGPYRDASRLYVLDDGRRFVLPLARRRGLSGTPGVEASLPDGWGIGGLVGPGRDRAAVAAVLADLGGRREVLTRIRPDPLDGALWDEAAGPDVVRRVRHAHVLDLSAGSDAVRAAMHKSTRRNVGKGERAGLRITDTATPAHLAAYHRLFVLSLGRWAGRSREPQWLATRRGVRRDPLSKLTAMADGLGDRFRLWMAWEDDNAVAGVIVLLGQASHYTRGAMDHERAGASQAPTLLQWLAIEEAAAAGCRTHHFGDTGSSASLARFKEGFGARPVDYADYGVERLPVTRVDRALRTGVKRAIGFRDGA
jgi:hypothetical protein